MQWDVSMATDSDRSGERETPGDDRVRGGAAVANGRSREDKELKARSGAARMAETPAPGLGARPLEGRKSFFEIYKRTQGTHTRTGTAIGAGVIILAGADFLYGQLQFDTGTGWMSWLQIGIPLVVMVSLGLVLWWLVGVNRRTCDFMIATEGEMKKVSWSGRRELIGSTKVVILFTVALACVLFMVDVAFMAFFNAIGVLHGASVRELFFGQ